MTDDADPVRAGVDVVPDLVRRQFLARCNRVTGAPLLGTSPDDGEWHTSE